MSRRVLIIGGGAAGLTAAIFAARAGAEVTVLEQNETAGKKLLASGNGRCNLSNLDRDLSHFHGSDREKIASVLEQFSFADTYAFFETLGLCLQQRDGWLYPATGTAGSVLALLLQEGRSLDVKYKNQECVRRLTKKEKGFLVETDGWNYKAESVVLACGSPASGVRGASEDARGLAESVGVAAAPFAPALVPLRGSGDFFSAWAGVRLFAGVELCVNGEVRAAETGEVQLTDFGISGIPVLQASAALSAADFADNEVTANLDFFPGKTEEELLSDFLGLQKRRKRTPRELLAGFLPDRLIPVILRTADILPHADFPDDAKEGRALAKRIAHPIKQFRLPISGTAGLRQAQVASGGVALSALTDQLEATACPGLFFAGECIDVHGDCGGYNLQWAWSSGAVTGRAAASVAGGKNS